MFMFSFILVLLSVLTSALIIIIYSLSNSLEEQLGAKAIAIARTVALLAEIKGQRGEEKG